jgi:hypothetical protein
MTNGPSPEGPFAAFRAGISGSLPGPRLDASDLDGDLAAVRGGVAGLLADLQSEDRGAQRRLLAEDVELGVAGDLAAADEEALLVARDDGGDDGAGLDDAVRAFSLRSPSSRAASMRFAISSRPIVDSCSSSAASRSYASCVSQVVAVASCAMVHTPVNRRVAPASAGANHPY